MFLGMRVVIYCRLSRRSDINAPNIDDQDARCREYAQRANWQIVEAVHDLGESAYDRDEDDQRPGFARVVELTYPYFHDGEAATLKQRSEEHTSELQSH